MNNRMNILSFDDVRATRSRTDICAHGKAKQTDKQYGHKPNKTREKINQSSRFRDTQDKFHISVSQQTRRSSTNRSARVATSSTRCMQSSYRSTVQCGRGTINASDVAQNKSKIHTSNRAVRNQLRTQSQKQEHQSSLGRDGVSQKKRQKARFATLTTAIQARRRAQTKERADRQFVRQFGSECATHSSIEPRAAVYTGRIGSSHKRAIRMQEHKKPRCASSGGARVVSSVGAHIVKKISLRKLSIFVGAAMCLVLICAFLYTPAQQYYHALRKYDQVAAELAAVQEQNETLEQLVALLETDEGVEELARTELGWVGEDEISVYIQGLTDSSDDEDTASTTGVIQTGSIEAPTTWYSPLLDMIFGEG